MRVPGHAGGITVLGKEDEMKWSWRIGRLLGIDVYMHATFLILLVWLGISYYLPRHRIADAVNGLDLSQMGSAGQTTVGYIDEKLGGDPERLLNETYLPYHISLRQPPDLSLADHVHRFIALNGS